MAGGGGETGAPQQPLPVGAAGLGGDRAPLVLRVGAYPHRAAETTRWERETLGRAGVRYAYCEAGAAALAGLLPEADVVLAGGGPWDRELIGRLRRCRLLVSCTVGLDHVDLEAAREAGVPVANMPELCTDEVADHALALILACVRKVAMLSSSVHAGGWDRSLLEPMPRLRGRVLGLFGLGRIARAVVARAGGFGMSVLACDPLVAPERARALGVRPVTLEELCRESDIISIHAPLTPATRHAIGAPQLAMMKPAACLVNTSRGALVDEEALTLALERGQIASAGLDVLELEPPHAGNRLLGMPNVVLTPHSGGFSDEVVDEIPVRAVAAALDALGRPPSASEQARPRRGRRVTDRDGQ